MLPDIAMGSQILWTSTENFISRHVSIFTYNVVQLQGETIKETGCFIFIMKITGNTNKTRHLVLAHCKAEKMVTQLLKVGHLQWRSCISSTGQRKYGTPGKCVVTLALRVWYVTYLSLQH